MKNALAAILAVVAVIGLGSLFMKNSSDPVDTIPVSNSTYQDLKAFQIGAYTNVESANHEANEKDALVVSDGKYYYVYKAILSNTANIEKMINYLNKENVYYYIKNIDSSQNFKDELYKYEEMMRQTTSDIAFLELNKRILALYERG